MPSSRRVPAWLFGVTCIPYGVSSGFALVFMPNMLAGAGISLDAIGWFTTATFLPSVLQFLYAPIVDLGPRRRTWLVLTSALCAACLAGALSMPLPSRKNDFLAFVVVAQLLAGLVGSANGGLMTTTLSDEQRGSAGGWFNAGNLGGAALGAGVLMTLSRFFSLPTVAAALAAMMILPSLAAFAIPEPPRPAQGALELFSGVLRDVTRTARSRPGWTGILFCISPVGTAALTSFFSALGADYHADGVVYRACGLHIPIVEFVTGYLSGLVSAVGSLLGGALCDRMNRRRAYLLSGALTAACALGMRLGGLTPTVYAGGALVYLFVSGFCYASFSAVVLEAIGTAGAAAATQYTLFIAAGNTAIAYTGFVDTRFYKGHGPSGLLLADALMNLGGIVALLAILRFVRRPVAAAGARAVE